MDLGCLEGYFAAECAAHGATVLGVDGKKLNIQKCEFVRSALRLEELTFVLDDVMNVTAAGYGSFNVILALGLLYHLDDPFTFLSNIVDICSDFVILDAQYVDSDPLAVVRLPMRVPMAPHGSWMPARP